MKHFELRGLPAALVSLMAAGGLLIGLFVLFGGGGVEALGTTNFDTLNVEDGTAAEPSVGFTADTDNGLYRVGTNNLGVAVGGAIVADFDSSGLDLNNKTLSNVGASGTDFGSGSLTLATFLQAANVTATTSSELGVAEGTSFTADTFVQAVNITVTGAFHQDGVAFSGPLVAFTGFITSGTTLAHGIGTTPTVASCTVFDATPFTYTLSITASNATTVGFGLYGDNGLMDAVGHTVYCIGTR